VRKVIPLCLLLGSQAISAWSQELLFKRLSDLHEGMSLQIPIVLGFAGRTWRELPNFNAGGTGACWEGYSVQVLLSDIVSPKGKAAFEASRHTRTLPILAASPETEVQMMAVIAQVWAPLSGEAQAISQGCGPQQGAPVPDVADIVVWRKKTPADQRSFIQATKTLQFPATPNEDMAAGGGLAASFPASAIVDSEGELRVTLEPGGEVVVPLGPPDFLAYRKARVDLFGGFDWKKEKEPE
jgi:hypothetical protein